MVRLFGEVCVCVWCSVCVCVWCSVGVHGEIQCVHHDHTVFSHTHTHTHTQTDTQLLLGIIPARHKHAPPQGL